MDVIGTGRVIKNLRDCGYSVSESDVSYAVRKGAIKPSAIVAGRRLWSDEDLEGLKEIFKDKRRDF